MLIFFLLLSFNFLAGYNKTLTNYFILVMLLLVLDVSVIVVSLKLGPKLLWKQVMVVSAAL